MTEKQRDPRLGICGTRDWKVLHQVTYAVECTSPDTIIYTGYGGLVDLQADFTARQLQRATVAIPAQWFIYGKGAGPKRNGKVVAAIDALIAFCCKGGSPGTNDAVEKAEAAGIPVLKIHEGMQTSAVFKLLREFISEHLTQSKS